MTREAYQTLYSNFDQPEMHQLNRQRLDDTIKNLSILERDYANTLKSIELQSSVLTGLGVTAAAGAGAYIGAYGGPMGAIVGAGIGGLKGLVAQLIFKEYETTKKMEVTREYERSRKQFFLYVEGMSKQWQSTSVTSSSPLQQDITAQSEWLSFIKDSNLPTDLKNTLISSSLVFFGNTLAKVQANIQGISQALDDLHGRDQKQQVDIENAKAAITDLSRVFSELSENVRVITENVAEHQEAINNLETQLGDIYQRLDQHEARLTKLEVVADLVFSELAKISTHNLERYDANIATLKTEYDALLSNPSADREVVLRKRNELEAAVQLRVGEISSLQTKFDVFFGITNLLMQFGQAINSVELQRSVYVIASVAKIGIGIAAMTGFGGIALKALVKGSTLGPAGMIASGVISLLSLFNHNNNDAIGDALEQISQQIQQISEQIQTLSQQIEQLGTLISQRFDRLEDILSYDRQLMLSNFRQVIELLEVFHRDMLVKFISTQSQIDGIARISLQISDKISQIIVIIEAGFEAIYAQDYRRIIAAVVNYYDYQEFGQVAPLPETTVRQALLSMLDWATQGVKHQILHGDLTSNYAVSQLSIIPVDDILNHVNLLLGILRTKSIVFSRQQLPRNLTVYLRDNNCELPPISNDRVINPLAFSAAVNNIIKLITHVPELNLISSDRCLLERLIQSGQHFLEFMLGLKTTLSPIQYFLDSYEFNLNQFIRLSYRKIIETMEVRGEDISNIFNSSPTLISLINSASEQHIPIQQDISQLVSSVLGIYQVIGTTCAFCLDIRPNNDPLADPRSNQGFCLNLSWQPPASCFGYNFSPNELSRIEELPTDDCHSDLIINKATACAGSAESQFDNQITRCSNNLAFSANLFSNLNWSSLTHRFIISSNSSLNTTDIINLVLRSIFEFQTCKIFPQASDNFSFTANDWINKLTTFTSLSSCGAYFIYSIRCNVPGCATYISFSPQRDKQSGIFAFLTDSANTAKRLLRSVEEKQINFENSLNNLILITTKLGNKLFTAQQLRMEELYYLSSPSSQQYKDMLAIIIDWFTHQATEAEKELVIDAILISINNRESIKKNLDNLNAIKNGLILYLSLAFNEEFYADETSQRILQLIFDGNDLASGLSNYANTTTELIFSSIARQLNIFNEPLLNSSERSTINFLSDVRNYFNTTISAGQRALVEGQLMPGYSWLLELLSQVAFYRDFFIPRGISLRDLTAERIFSAVKRNETEIIELLDTPKLDLVNIRNNEGNTPYLLAVKDCNINVTTTLFILDAFINAVNNNSQSALNLAMQCSFSSTRIELLKSLLSQGVTTCDPADNLLDAMIMIRNQHPFLVRNVTCMVLPPLPQINTSTSHISSSAIDSVSRSSIYSSSGAGSISSSSGSHIRSSFNDGDDGKQSDDDENLFEKNYKDILTWGGVAIGSLAGTFILVILCACIYKIYRRLEPPVIIHVIAQGTAVNAYSSSEKLELSQVNLVTENNHHLLDHSQSEIPRTVNDNLQGAKTAFNSDSSTGESILDTAVNISQNLIQYPMQGTLMLMQYLGFAVGSYRNKERQLSAQEKQTLMQQRELVQQYEGNLSLLLGKLKIFDSEFIRETFYLVNKLKSIINKAISDEKISTPAFEKISIDLDYLKNRTHTVRDCVKKEDSWRFQNQTFCSKPQRQCYNLTLWSHPDYVHAIQGVDPQNLLYSDLKSICQ